MVYIARTCCEKAAATCPILGVPFRVERIQREHCACIYCAFKTTVMEAFGDHNHFAPVEWLNRIPPLDELDGCSEDARHGQNEGVKA